MNVLLNQVIGLPYVPQIVMSYAQTKYAPIHVVHVHQLENKYSSTGFTIDGRPLAFGDIVLFKFKDIDNHTCTTYMVQTNQMYLEELENFYWTMPKSLEVLNPNNFIPLRYWCNPAHNFWMKTVRFNSKPFNDQLFKNMNDTKTKTWFLHPVDKTVYHIWASNEHELRRHLKRGIQVYVYKKEIYHDGDFVENILFVSNHDD